MVSDTTKRLWKKDYVQTAVMIIVILVVVFGLWFGSQTVLGTQYPALAVASGSMCKVQFMSCDGWSHPFERTLHTGDLIIIQGVNPNEVESGQDPEGDIIVFHKPNASPDFPDELIVHRAIEKVTGDNGLVYFKTKGDGSSNSYGDIWNQDWRGTNYSSNGMVSEKLLVGKVVMRIPWIGHLALFMRESSAIYIVVILILILVAIEFAVPMIRNRKAESQPEESQETTSET